MAFRNSSKAIGTAWTQVYICPVGFEAVVHSLYVSNTDNINDISIDIQITTNHSSSGGSNGSFYVLRGIKILANTTLVLDKPLNLRANDFISLKSSAATCDCVASILTTLEEVTTANP